MVRYGTSHPIQQNVSLHSIKRELGFLERRIEEIVNAISTKENLMNLISIPAYSKKEDFINFTNLFYSLLDNFYHPTKSAQNKTIEEIEDHLNYFHQYLSNLKSHLDKNSEIIEKMGWNTRGTSPAIYPPSGLINISSKKPEDDGDTIDSHEKLQQSKILHFQNELYALKQTSENFERALYQSCLFVTHKRDIPLAVDLFHVMAELGITEAYCNSDLINAAWDDIAMLERLMLNIKFTPSTGYSIWMKAIGEENAAYLELCKKNYIPLPKSQQVNCLKAAWDRPLALSSLLESPVKLSAHARKYLWLHAIETSAYQHLDLLNKNTISIPKMLFSSRDYSVEHLAALKNDENVINAVFNNKSANLNEITLANATIWQHFCIVTLLPISAPIRWLLGKCGLIEEPYLKARGTTALHILAQTNSNLYNQLISNTKFEFDCSIIDENGKTAHQVFIENQRKRAAAEEAVHTTSQLL